LNAGKKTGISDWNSLCCCSITTKKDTFSCLQRIFLAFREQRIKLKFKYSHLENVFGYSEEIESTESCSYFRARNLALEQQAKSFCFIISKKHRLTKSAVSIEQKLLSRFKKNIVSNLISKR